MREGGQGERQKGHRYETRLKKSLMNPAPSGRSLRVAPPMVGSHGHKSMSICVDKGFGVHVAVCLGTTCGLRVCRSNEEVIAKWTHPYRRIHSGTYERLLRRQEKRGRGKVGDIPELTSLRGLASGTVAPPSTTRQGSNIHELIEVVC